MSDDDYLWDPLATPDPEIAELESRLRPLAYRPEPLRHAVAAVPPERRLVRRAMAAAAAAVLIAGGWYATRTAAPWTVAAIQGAPVVRTSGGAPSAVLTVGGVVETNARSSARVAVGRIGRAELGPQSRLRLVRAGGAEHRLALEHGTLHAWIDAPPRYFLVETASALATDLGCVYTLTVDEAGNGALTVEEGEVELERDGVRSSVLAGNRSALHRGAAPGLPYPVSASRSLADAVARFDASPHDTRAVNDVLVASDARSTITLWHLLQRAEPADRGRVYDRLATISPPPATVTRERALRGESGALQRWRTALQPAWAVEAPLWRRAWNALRSR